MASDKYARIVTNRLLQNSPITAQDIQRGYHIYRPPLTSIQGRTRNQEFTRVKEQAVIQIPKRVYKDLRNVTLCGDFFYINGIAVLNTILRRIDYKTVDYPMTRSKQDILKSMRKVQQHYHSQGFRIIDLHADNAFEKIKSEILPIRLECCGVDKHVPEVERSIQTIRNKSRSMCNALPYKILPRVMTKAITTTGMCFPNTKESHR